VPAVAANYKTSLDGTNPSYVQLPGQGRLLSITVSPRSAVDVYVRMPSASGLGWPDDVGFLIKAGTTLTMDADGKALDVKQLRLQAASAIFVDVLVVYE